jgi:hypothetical protein
MQELQDAVATAFANVVAAGTIEKAIEKKLTDTITSIIDEQLRSYSDFGKSLSAHVKSALQVDFDKLGLPGYNDFILKLVRAQVSQQAEDSIARQVEAQLKELLEPAPKEITLSALVEEFIKFSDDETRYSSRQPDQITLISERDNSFTSSVFHHIGLDPEPRKRRYDCAYEISVHDGKVYSIRLDGTDPSKHLLLGSLRGFRRRLFQLHAAGTKLIIDRDADEINTYYPGRGD